MGSAAQQLEELRAAINDGFLILEYSTKDGMYLFRLPGHEYGFYLITVPDCTELQGFLASSQYRDALMKPEKIGAVLLDLVGFSMNPDETQLKMIVRYQCKIRESLRTCEVARLISTGDGMVIVFDQDQIGGMLKCVQSLDRGIARYNDEFFEMAVKPLVHRIGVHIGEAYLFRDVKRELNYVGGGINFAQRMSTLVPDPGDTTPTQEEGSRICVSEGAYKIFVAAGVPAGTAFSKIGPKVGKHGERLVGYAMTY
ncbi:MAG: adenylate/guanylate cyclase domain-containing protein [Candidatus Eisenbacteria sp.]|nr:adenylate/guanylate cyclase domain-containing protein [Candidatus Eisenbacteria bacterium]